MKVSIKWLKELVDLKTPVEELVRLLPLRTIGTKEVTDNFIELDMKGYNRADLLSLRGVAYEVSAITDSVILFEESLASDYIWTERGMPDTKVEIVEEKLAEAQLVAKI